MSEPQDTWALFAAAWLARAGDPRPHAETEQEYAVRQTNMAGAVATRMLQIRDLRFSQASAPPAHREGPPQHAFQPSTVRAVRQALAESGMEVGPPGYTPSPLVPDGLPPPLVGPSISPQNNTAHTGGLCVRGFNGKKRGEGQDCPGSYDAQGICSTCRLPASTPAERALQQGRPGATP
jgi:hypothetical protein